jgi:hypothetical protein
MGRDVGMIRARVGLGSGMDVTDDTGCEENEVDIRKIKEYNGLLWNGMRCNLL